jgi:hypothetical protein
MVRTGAWNTITTGITIESAITTTITAGTSVRKNTPITIIMATAMTITAITATVTISSALL